MYAFTHKGKAYGPGGQIVDTAGNPLAPEDAAAFNAEVEKQEIEYLKTGPDRLFLYVREGSPAGRPTLPGDIPPTITTWPGTVVSSACVLGRVYKVSAFGGPSTRQSVKATIYGREYYGTYYRSSGSYCRLKARR